MCHTIDMYVFWHFLWCTNPQIINVEVVKIKEKGGREREGVGRERKVSTCTYISWKGER